MSRRAVALVLLIASAAGPTTARADGDRPETSHLVAAGIGMAIPTYFLGVVAHEGSHALAAKMSGATVQTLHLLPGFRRGKFYFGYVEVRGLRCDRQRIAFLLAPKLTDAVLLAAHSLSHFSGARPDHRYGQLALTVLATGFWIDFSKDIVAFWDHNDLVKVYDLIGADTELRRLPLRLVHAGLSAAAAVAIVRGYQDVFADDAGELGPAAALPLWVGSF